MHALTHAARTRLVEKLEERLERRVRNASSSRGRRREAAVHEGQEEEGSGGELKQEPSDGSGAAV
jgi:hypothetical protein